MVSDPTCSSKFYKLQGAFAFDSRWLHSWLVEEFVLPLHVELVEEFLLPQNEKSFSCRQYHVFGAANEFLLPLHVELVEEFLLPSLCLAANTRSSALQISPAQGLSADSTDSGEAEYFCICAQASSVKHILRFVMASARSAPARSISKAESKDSDEQERLSIRES
jgi:hypothetical protein